MQAMYDAFVPSNKIIPQIHTFEPTNHEQDYIETTVWWIHSPKPSTVVDYGHLHKWVKPEEAISTEMSPLSGRSKGKKILQILRNSN